MTKTFLKAALLATTTLLAQPVMAARPTLGPDTMPFVSVSDPVIAITNVKVVDGTGAAPRAGQTIVLNDGIITALGPTGATQVPAGARVIDGKGKTVIPGLIHMHEHLFYTILQGKAYSYNAETFTKLYLSGGVTSMRTGGSMHFAGDLHMRDSINAGLQAGPWIDTTGPYINQAGSVPQLMTIKNPEEATAAVNFYADQGAMSFKAYMHVTRAELGAAIQAAHKRKIKLTAHLCSVTLMEAADLGIDNIEHGLGAASDFRAGKEVDKCSGGDPVYDPKKVDEVMDHLIKKGVAMTSNVALSDTDREQPGLDVLAPNVAAMFFENRRGPLRKPSDPPSERLLRQIGFDKKFMDKGGVLMIGTDPTGSGGVVPGFSNIHEIELRAENGFKFEDVIKASTMNAATYMNRQDRVGSLAVGKQADVVLINGDPATKPREMRNIEVVFKEGYGYDPKKLVEAVRGKAGLY
ncbi:MAG: amidohydrolase family protein [Rhodospirillaceae bacterium]|nr:amidohydrolase family protein [Rhodospirillaceae bacterium]